MNRQRDNMQAPYMGGPSNYVYEPMDMSAYLNMMQSLQTRFDKTQSSIDSAYANLDKVVPSSLYHSEYGNQKREEYMKRLDALSSNLINSDDLDATLSDMRSLRKDFIQDEELRKYKEYTQIEDILAKRRAQAGPNAYEKYKNYTIPQFLEENVGMGDIIDQYAPGYDPLDEYDDSIGRAPQIDAQLDKILSTEGYSSNRFMSMTREQLEELDERYAENFNGESRFVDTRDAIEKYLFDRWQNDSSPMINNLKMRGKKFPDYMDELLVASQMKERSVTTETARKIDNKGDKLEDEIEEPEYDFTQGEDASLGNIINLGEAVGRVQKGEGSEQDLQLVEKSRLINEKVLEEVPELKKALEEVDAPDYIKETAMSYVISGAPLQLKGSLGGQDASFTDKLLALMDMTSSGLVKKIYSAGEKLALHNTLGAIGGAIEESKLQELASKYKVTRGTIYQYTGTDKDRFKRYASNNGWDLLISDKGTGRMTTQEVDKEVMGGFAMTMSKNSNAVNQIRVMEGDAYAEIVVPAEEVIKWVANQKNAIAAAGESDSEKLNDSLDELLESVSSSGTVTLSSEINSLDDEILKNMDPQAIRSMIGNRALYELPDYAGFKSIPEAMNKAYGQVFERLRYAGLDMQMNEKYIKGDAEYAIKRDTEPLYYTDGAGEPAIRGGYRLKIGENFVSYEEGLDYLIRNISSAKPKEDVRQLTEELFTNIMSKNDPDMRNEALSFRELIDRKGIRDERRLKRELQKFINDDNRNQEFNFDSEYSIAGCLAADPTKVEKEGGKKMIGNYDITELSQVMIGPEVPASESYDYVDKRDPFYKQGSLTGMTVGELVDNPGPRRGKYQFMGDTLKGILPEAARYGVTRDSLFDEETQDKLALALLDDNDIETLIKQGAHGAVRERLKTLWRGFGDPDPDNEGKYVTKQDKDAKYNKATQDIEVLMKAVYRIYGQPYTI